MQRSAPIFLIVGVVALFLMRPLPARSQTLGPINVTSISYQEVSAVATRKIFQVRNTGTALVKFYVNVYEQAQDLASNGNAPWQCGDSDSGGIGGACGLRSGNKDFVENLSPGQSLSITVLGSTNCHEATVVEDCVPVRNATISFEIISNQTSSAPSGLPQSTAQIANIYLDAASAYLSAAGKVPANQPNRRACYQAQANYYRSLALQLNSSYQGPAPNDPADSPSCLATATEGISSAGLSAPIGNSSPQNASGTSAGSALLAAIGPSQTSMPASSLAQNIIAQASGSLSVGTSNTVAAVGLATDAISSMIKGIASAFAPLPPSPPSLPYGFKDISQTTLETMGATADRQFDELEPDLAKTRTQLQRAYLSAISSDAQAISHSVILTAAAPAPQTLPASLTGANRRSAHFVDGKSAYEMALLYRDGTGVPKDAASEYAWLHIAAVRGYNEAVPALLSLRNHLTDLQISRALQIYSAQMGHRQ